MKKKINRQTKNRSKKNKKQNNKKLKHKDQKQANRQASYPLKHAIIKNTVRHNIAQMTSTSKACFLTGHHNKMMLYNSTRQVSTR